MKKSILITGCSSGIGLAAAVSLSQRGHQVFATARKETDLMDLEEKGLIALPLDITDSNSIRMCLDTILSRTNGTLDAVFNNAGIVVPGAVEDLSTELIHRQFLTNVYGPIELIHQVLPIMRQQGHGRIIQNSSILGIITMPYTSAYSASKFALEAFSDGLAQELRGTNIYVSCINPGPIKSKLRQHSYETYQDCDFNDSAHQVIYKKMERQYFKPSKLEKIYTQQPQAVIKKLIHAVESKRPKRHYYVGPIAWGFVFLKHVLTFPVLSWICSNAR